MTWAFLQPIPQSSTKFVLVALSNRAEAGTWQAWPSTTSLSEDTAQDRKTVLTNLRKLIELGYIRDTGERRGMTRQVIVYQLNGAEIGTVKEDQKRNSSKNGTVPNFPVNSTVFPTEQYRFSQVTVPKTGHGTSQEPIKEPVNEPIKSSVREPAIEIPSWLPPDVWSEWCKYRQGGKGRFTAKARALSLRTLTALHAQGFDAREVIERSIERGWTGLFPPKENERQHARRPSVTDHFTQSNYESSSEDELPEFLRSPA